MKTTLDWRGFALGWLIILSPLTVTFALRSGHGWVVWVLLGFGTVIICRAAAADYLGRLGAKDAVPALTEAAAVEDSRVRSRATEALGRLRAAAAYRGEKAKGDR